MGESGLISRVAMMNKASPIHWLGHELREMHTFPSKKNRVQLVTCGDETTMMVFKQLTDPAKIKREAQILTMLQGKVAVPALLGEHETGLLLEYIPGGTLADWLERAEKENPDSLLPAVQEKMGELLDWLAGFYKVMENQGQAMIMGDVNLRNFIVGKQLTGIDFEDVKEGLPAEDLGKVAAFILMYAPEGTIWKQKLVDFWLAQAARGFSQDRALLVREMEQELQAMQIRRKIKTVEG